MRRGQWNKKQFNDTQVAELGLRGIEVNGVDEFMSKEQKPEYAEVVNGFYSPIEQGLLDIKETELPANEWIKKLQGFTEQDELKYTGIEEWLKQQGKVTKQEILDYLKNNRVQLVEVVKGEQGRWDGDNLINANGEQVATLIDNGDGTWSLILL